MQNLSLNEFNQIEKMRGLSLDKLKQIAKIRIIKNYEYMKKDDLIISLLKSKRSIAELFNNNNNNNNNNKIIIIIIIIKIIISMKMK